MKVSFIKIGNVTYPVAFPFSALEEMEESLGMSIAEILSNLTNVSAKVIRVIVQSGLNHGAKAQGKPDQYGMDELNTIFQGNMIHSFKIITEILIKDAGMNMVMSDLEKEEAKKKGLTKKT